MIWWPADLPGWVAQLAKAMEQRFALKRPDAPVRVPSYAETDLPNADSYPYAMAINTTSKALVITVLNAGGTAYEWVNADGTAL